MEFENYRGPVFNENQPLCIPICPITVTSQTEIGFHERQQLPLRLAWALTIHKSQGLTLPKAIKAWIDIGKSERIVGVSYVAISRVKSLAFCVIEPMTYEWLTSLKSSVTNLQYRLEEEENRLDHIAQATSCAFRTANYWVWVMEGFDISIPVIVWIYNYKIITNLLIAITVCMKIFWFARQNKGKLSVCPSPSACPFHSFTYHYVSNYLSIISFYSFAILMDVKGAMLTARWNQIIVPVKI